MVGEERPRTLRGNSEGLELRPPKTAESRLCLRSLASPHCHQDFHARDTERYGSVLKRPSEPRISATRWKLPTKCQEWEANMSALTPCCELHCVPKALTSEPRI
jgi:hypothetical protein